MHELFFKSLIIKFSQFLIILSGVYSMGPTNRYATTMGLWITLCGLCGEAGNCAK